MTDVEKSSLEYIAEALEAARAAYYEKLNEYDIDGMCLPLRSMRACVSSDDFETVLEEVRWEEKR